MVADIYGDPIEGMTGRPAKAHYKAKGLLYSKNTIHSKPLSLSMHLVEQGREICVNIC